MAYVKNNWVDREGTTRYFETVDDDGALILTPDYTQVTEMGTPVNADNMNHIEEGIAAGSFTKYDSMATYAKNDLVTTIVDNELKVYKSLQDNNTNTLDDSSFWEEVEFSGGSSAGLQLFDTVLKDHILTYAESKGLALQGTYVYKDAIAGSRYGYPDFYNKCLEERNTATATQVTLGGSTITMYVASNGHQYYDIANKDVVDTFFGTMGTAWFYGVDTENERIFLPRNNTNFALASDTADLNKVINGTRKLVYTYKNGDDFCNWYSDGWLEQGGYSNSATITFLKPFSDTNYNVQVTGYTGSNRNVNARTSSKTTTSVYIYAEDNMAWLACGYGAIPTEADYNLTEQPEGLKQLLYICVGNTTNYEGMTEVVNQGMEILEQVAQKVNVDGTNLNNEGKSYFAGLGMPSSTSIALSNSLTEFTAQADGYLYLRAKTTVANGYVYVDCGYGNITNYAPAVNYLASFFGPVRKGQRCVFGTGGATMEKITFRYAVGSESEAE